MSECYKAIALLDSGVGGLTVVKEIYRQLPREHVVYFGDTVRMPYGPRPHEQVREFVLQIIEFLETQEIKLMIVACNSATAAGINYYRDRFPHLPIMGVINPGVKAALAKTKTKKIGVIGTSGTIASGAYEAAIKRQDPSVSIFSQACPLFVLLVENNLVHTPEARKVAETYLMPLKEKGIDTLIMGCTHYPLMSDVLQDILGNDISLISSAEETARQAEIMLSDRNLLNAGDTSPRHRFYVSGDPKPFKKIGDELLAGSITPYQLIL